MGAEQSFARDYRELSARRSDQPGWLAELRESAFSDFDRLGLPTTKLEDWKYTSVAALKKTEFSVADGEGHRAAQLAAEVALEGCDRLVFVDGRYVAELSEVEPVDGISIGNLSEQVARRPELLREHLGRYADRDRQAFTALNTALCTDGLCVHVAAGVKAPRPVQLVSIATEQRSPATAQLRHLVIAGRSSELTLIESCIGDPTGAYFNNVVSEIGVGENARLDHYRVQAESDATSHVATVQARIERAGSYRCHSFLLGGKLVRNDINSELVGPGASAAINGLFFADGDRHVDTHTLIDHREPHCESHELYKGVLAGRAKGVFNGKVVVRQAAQKTDAKQSNANLLLSPDATINTKPQLEIFADDVKCTHGATIGQLDEDALFYLRARGIAEPQARAMLVFAFGRELVDDVRVAALRDQLERAVRRRFRRELAR